MLNNTSSGTLKAMKAFCEVADDAHRVALQSEREVILAMIEKAKQLHTNSSAAWRTLEMLSMAIRERSQQ